MAYKVLFKIALYFDFFFVTTHFLSKAFMGSIIGVEMEVLSYPLNFFQYSQREEDPQASKPNKSIHLLSATFEATICGEITKVYIIDLVIWLGLVGVELEVHF
jgi:hypothetical protein